MFTADKKCAQLRILGTPLQNPSNYYKYLFNTDTNTVKKMNSGTDMDTGTVPETGMTTSTASETTTDTAMAMSTARQRTQTLTWSGTRKRTLTLTRTQTWSLVMHGHYQGECTQGPADRDMFCGPQGTVGHSSCGWRRKGDVARTPWHVSSVWYGRPSNLASPPWKFVRIDRQCTFVADIVLGWQNWAGRLQRHGLHRRGVVIWRSAGKCTRSTLVPAVHSRYPSHSVGSWPWNPLLRWRWSTVHLRKVWKCRLNDFQGDSPASPRSASGCRQTDWSSIPKKKQFIWLGSSRQLQKVTVDSITLAGNTLSFQSSVNDLGVLIDGRLSMCDHVQRVCRSSYYQLRQLRAIRNSLSTKTCAALVHAFVTSRLDYCNSLLAGINKELLNKLESVLRSAARLAMGKRRFDPITKDMRDILHWLPVRQRVDFKLGVLVFKCLRGDAPSYLVESVSSVADQPNLRSRRSATRGDLVVPRTRTVKMGPRSFYVSGPTLWNSLPLELRSYELTLETFKAKLKSHLFRSAYIS